MESKGRNLKYHAFVVVCGLVRWLGYRQRHQRVQGKKEILSAELELPLRDEESWIIDSGVMGNSFQILLRLFLSSLMTLDDSIVWKWKECRCHGDVHGAMVFRRVKSWRLESGECRVVGRVFGNFGIVLRLSWYLNYRRNSPSFVRSSVHS
jgi:hypothetical protein